MAEKESYCYIHLPKQAGSYIKKVCRKNKNIVFIDEIDPLNQEETLQWYRNAVANPSVVTFSSVRNPFDLLLSYWFSKFQASPNRGHMPNYMGVPAEIWDDMRVRPEPFSKFLEDFVKYKKERRNNTIWQHYQARFLYFQLFDAQGNCKMDHVFRQETLTEELEKFLTGEGFEIEQHVLNERFNASRIREISKIDYKEFYTDSDRALVEENFKLELDMFGYSYDGLDDSSAPVNPSKLIGPRWSEETWEIL